jgi:hypothetical protein
LRSDWPLRWYAAGARRDRCSLGKSIDDEAQCEKQARLQNAGLAQTCNNARILNGFFVFVF